MGIFILADAKLKIKSLQKDLIIKMLCDVALGYVTRYILKSISIVLTIMIALLKEKIADYYLYLGAFYGIVQGLFWSTGHSLINQNVAFKENISLGILTNILSFYNYFSIYISSIFV